MTQIRISLTENDVNNIVKNAVRKAHGVDGIMRVYYIDNPIEGGTFMGVEFEDNDLFEYEAD